MFVIKKSVLTTFEMHFCFYDCMYVVEVELHS